MNQDLPTQLELLVPWDLPLEQSLSRVDRQRVGSVLCLFLAALQEPLPQVALVQVEQALAQLGTVETEAMAVHYTKTPLTQPQIEDFDHYFAAIHVQSADAIGCIVRGLLLTYRRVLQLWQADSRSTAIDRRLNPTQLQQQQQGFRSYVALLARAFELDLEPISVQRQEES